MHKRLDVLICELFNVSREFAKEVILAGECFVDGKLATRPGAKFSLNSQIVINAKMPRFVSRGGEKMAKAINVFGLDLQGLYCMDIGASTGGFTDCMLQNGAKQVLAVENGVGQLHPKLLTNERVISWENTDIRNIEMAQMPFVPQFAAVDLSFISITNVLPKIAELFADKGKLVILIKPQFEVGRGKIGKRGVVRNKTAHIDMLRNVTRAVNDVGLSVLSLDFSPIKGQNGNIEYLLLADAQNVSSKLDDKVIQGVVEQVFLEL
ncbi:MAG: TlyA family RNA methyltransferase [Defluviitaleaceae bacterium]|nr:TlyA family RNA methyltransferase [Defluviitaleaceae bacterium]